MLSRRSFLSAAAAVPAARVTRAHAATAPALPDAVKSHSAPYPTFGSVNRLDPAIDKLLPTDAKLEKLAEGFEWTEGPVWVKGKGKQPGYLLFSEIPLNSIYKWEEGKGVSLFLKPAG
jgi:hypothetical protein